MSEAINNPNKSHTLRLAVTMLCGALVGPFLFGLHGGEIVGAVLGLCFEMLTRCLQEYEKSRDARLLVPATIVLLLASAVVVSCWLS